MLSFLWGLGGFAVAAALFAAGFVYGKAVEGKDHAEQTPARLFGGEKPIVVGCNAAARPPAGEKTGSGGQTAIDANLRKWLNFLNYDGGDMPSPDKEEGT